VTLLFVLAIVGALDTASAEGTAQTQGWGLAQLMAGMRSVRQASARFDELRFARMLKQPLRSYGKLIYVAPDRLRKQTLAPVPSELSINGDRVTVRQPDGTTRDLTLSEIPELGVLVESMRATLAGDTTTLTHDFSPTLAGTPSDWLLQLEPRDPRLSKLLTMVRILGEGTSIRGIETIERDGDRTEMTITPDPE
jgi:outer membrane lipoprotein-sorting protein